VVCRVKDVGARRGVQQRRMHRPTLAVRCAHTITFSEHARYRFFCTL
jgi:hypothetical protein